MSTLSEAGYKQLCRLLSPTVTKILDEELATIATGEVAVGSDVLTPTVAHTTNQVAAFGQLVVFNATAGALTCTAPNPAGNAGKSWGMKLATTASSHTITAVAHGAETFDGGAAPATSTAGALYKFTSDGTNWVITGKI